MKKILFFAILFFPVISSAFIMDPEECGIKGKDCTSSASCPNNTYCWIAPPAMPGGQGAKSGKCIPGDGPADSTCTPPATLIGGGQDNKKEKVKKEKTENPCPGTLEPNTMTIRDLMASWRPRDGHVNQPTAQPQRAYPLAPGTTANGFRAGSGFAPGPGEPLCTWMYADPIVKKYFECVNTVTPRKTQKECLAENPDLPDLTIANNLRGKFDCKENNANVFDALWGFLTHRKPY